MKRFLGFIVMIICLVVVAPLTGCNQKEQVLDAEKPVVINLWHCYNSYAKAVLDDMILEFNETEGAKKGIIVEASNYGEQGTLEEALYNSANKMIGAENMPDLFVAYPDNAYRIDKNAPLADLSQYFTEDELSEYRQEFLEEGIWDGANYPKMIPIAKSTEILYLNKTDWNKFASETGMPTDDNEIIKLFSTWESIAQIGEKYYNWSGKPMLGFNLNNDFIEVTAAELGEEPYRLDGDKVVFSYSKEAARKVWDICYVPHLEGWYQSSHYNQDGIKSGDLIAYIGSSAGSGYFPKEITLSADECYPIECKVMQYPTFEGAEKYKSQRGANMCITGSDKIHEYAAAEFIKWFTDTEQNVKFTTATGYIPVKYEALEAMDKVLNNIAETDNKQAIKSSVEATLKSIEVQKFFAKKPFKNSYDVNEKFYNSLFEKIDIDLKELKLRVEKGESREKVIFEMEQEENFNQWYDGLMIKVSDSM